MQRDKFVRQAESNFVRLGTCANVTQICKLRPGHETVALSPSVIHPSDSAAGVRQREGTGIVAVLRVAYQRPVLAPVFPNGHDISRVPDVGKMGALLWWPLPKVDPQEKP
jgi:hypothetical protein